MVYDTSAGWRRGTEISCKRNDDSRWINVGLIQLQFCELAQPVGPQSQKAARYKNFFTLGKIFHGEQNKFFSDADLKCMLNNKNRGAVSFGRANNVGRR